MPAVDTISGLTKTTFQYIDDLGVKRKLRVSDRFNGQTAGTGLSAADGSESGEQKAHFARHIWLESIDPDSNGHYRRRKVYYNRGTGNGLATALAHDFGTVDGTTWESKGYVGEKEIG